MKTAQQDNNATTEVREVREETISHQCPTPEVGPHPRNVCTYNSIPIADVGLKDQTKILCIPVVAWRTVNAGGGNQGVGDQSGQICLTHALQL